MTEAPVRESDLVKGIVDGLRLRGRTVLVVGQWRADRAGTTPGTPDVLVASRSWHAAWIGLEVKIPTGRLSPAQKALADAGQTIVVRSIEDAFAAVGETI